MAGYATAASGVRFGEEARVSKPVRRIVALLRLAATTANEHEAATARAHAERLQATHKVSNQEIAPFLDTEESVSFRAMVHDFWRETLLQALARDEGCAYTWHGSTVTIAGVGATTVREKYLYAAAAIDLRKARGQETVRSFVNDNDFFEVMETLRVQKDADRLQRIYRRQFEIEATSQIVDSIEALTRRPQDPVAHPVFPPPSPSQATSASALIQEADRDEHGIPASTIAAIKKSAAMGALPFGKQIFHKIVTWKTKKRYLMECKTCTEQVAAAQKTCTEQVAAARADAVKLLVDLQSRKDQEAMIKRLQSEAEADRATITRLGLELNRARKDNEALQVMLDGRSRTTTDKPLLEID